MSGLIGAVSGWLGSATGKLKAGKKLLAADKPAEAFPLLAQAAQSGLPEAEFLVARAYLEGRGVPPSAAEGARWLERAAAQGLADAQSMLAALYIRGIPALASSLTGAAGAASEATALVGGRPAAALFAAVEGAQPDFEKAVLWSRKAAEQGSADGQALLAFVLTSGPEDLRDLDEAERLYRLSAEADCPQGCLGYALALMRKAKGPEE